MVVINSNHLCFLTLHITNVNMKILFITSGSIGDAVISTGIIGYLMDKYPNADFTVAGGEAAVTIFSAAPKVEKIIIIKKQKYHKHWLNLWKEVRKTRWDIVVDLRGSLLSFLLFTKKRYIFYKPDKNKSKAWQLSDLLGLDFLPPTRLWASAEHQKQAIDLLPVDKKIIVIAPKTNSAAKDWAIENFAQLAVNIAKPDIVFVVLAALEQKESVQFLVNSLPEQMLDLSGKTDLLTAYAIMERSHLFIGNDSGLLHIAAASGIKCVGIYGSSNDKMYAPQRKNVKIVKSYDFRINEPEKRDNKYMQMISVDMVEQAIVF